MDPIPETSEAIEEFGPFVDGEDLLGRLRRMGERVRAVVPSCVGLSLGLREHGVTFTVVASEETIAALDGLQYLDDGPCVAAVREERVIQFPDEQVLGEEAWHLFSRGTAAAAVASTLTLPIVREDEVVGSVNMYAAAEDAFDGKHDAVAAVVGGWAPGAVANADLSFSTRRAAQEAPRLLYEEMRIQVALGILVASLGITVEAARDRLRDAATRAGITETAMAKAVIAQATQGGGEDLMDEPPPAQG
jgi:GAF domain-containing protein